MHSLLVFFAVIAISLAQPQRGLPVTVPRELQVTVPRELHHHHLPHVSGAIIPILRQTQDVDPNSGYHWSYSSGNGITAEESATIIPLGPEQSDTQVRGSYEYVSLEGIPVSVQYHADSTGFHPIVKIHIGHSGPHAAKAL